MSLESSLTTLVALLGDMTVRSGERPEEYAQRCALRCWAQCTHAADIDPCARTCYERCVDELGSVTDSPSVRDIVTAVGLLVCLVTTLVAFQTSGSMRALVRRVSGAHRRVE